MLLNSFGTSETRHQGQSISFNCSAFGIPTAPSITWRRNGELLPVNFVTSKYKWEELHYTTDYLMCGDYLGLMSVLTVSDLKASDHGTYSCRADIGQGEGVVMQKPYYLVVEEGDDNSRLLVPTSCYLYIFSMLLWHKSSMCTSEK